MKLHHLTGSHKLILFLIVPILSFIDSMHDSDRRSSKVIITLFCGLVGWASGPYNKGADLFHYIEKAKEQMLGGDSAYYLKLADYLTFEQSTGKDFYFETVAFVVSQFTSNYHYVFLVVGLIFGYFFSNVYGFVLTYIKKNSSLNRYYSSLIFLLFMTLPYTSLCSVRFWTAGYMSIFIFYKVFVEKKYICLIFLPVTFFIHAGYIIAIFLTLLSLALMKTRHINRYLLIVVLLSIPFSYLSLILGEAYIDYVPVFLQKSVRSYLFAENLRDTSGGSGFYLIGKASQFMVSTLLYVLIILLLVKRRNITDNNDQIYTLALVFLSFSNFTMVSPSIGGRYLALSVFLVIFVWCSTFRECNYRKLVNFIPIVYSFSFVYWIYFEIPSSTGYLPLLLSPLISFISLA